MQQPGRPNSFQHQQQMRRQQQMQQQQRMWQQQQQMRQRQMMGWAWQQEQKKKRKRQQQQLQKPRFGSRQRGFTLAEPGDDAFDAELDYLLGWEDDQDWDHAEADEGGSCLGTLFWIAVIVVIVLVLI